MVGEKHLYFVNVLMKDMRKWHLVEQICMNMYEVGIVPAECANCSGMMEY